MVEQSKSAEQQFCQGRYLLAEFPASLMRSQGWSSSSATSTHTYICDSLGRDIGPMQRVETGLCLDSQEEPVKPAVRQPGSVQNL